MTRWYSKRTCYICDPPREISGAGVAWVSHGRAHVRRGEAIERKDWTGHLEFLGIGTARKRVEYITEQLQGAISTERWVRLWEERRELGQKLSQLPSPDPDS